MAITASDLSITLRWTWATQQMQTRRFFRTDGAAFLTATAEGVGEAYWNHVKTVWRALVPTANTNVFTSVLVEEVGGLLGFGEYAIPVGEQGGTRTGVTGDFLASFVNVGVRYTVATRVTRPGQMRIPFLFETDATGQNVASGFKTLCNSLAAVYSLPLALGAPVATGMLHHEVVTLGPGPGLSIAARQDVVGYVTNDVLTSQRSRRQGHGT